MTIKHLKKGMRVRFKSTDGSGVTTGIVMKWVRSGEITDLRSGRRYRVWDAIVKLDNPKPYRADGKVMVDEYDSPRVADIRIAR